MLAFELEDHVKPESWEDIVNRTAHQASVDTRKSRSYRVKGLYAFERSDATCGANACQKNHNESPRVFRRLFCLSHAA